jgi:UDP-3-O-[3-hydroxymyristoyl] N-acetylglucosamine deacetylase
MSTILQQQATLREAIEFTGTGLHTGAAARVRVHPAAAGHGLRFRLDDAVEFPAHADFIVDTQRATVLGLGGHRVSTVEHLLSALAGAGISNATIAVDGPEIPAADGSAATFVDAIVAAGIVEQGLPRRCVTLAAPRVFRDGDKLLVLLPAPAFRVRLTIDFAPPIGVQSCTYDGASGDYRREIAPNRTFGYRHEVEALLAAGLARGGSLDNAVVFDVDGPMSPLRSPDEPVRHKVLDLIGDFTLLGADPCFEVLAFKTGHALHAAAVREVAPQPIASAS